MQYGLNIKIVKWNLPPHTFIKLNSNSSCKCEDYEGGGVIRTDKGKRISTYNINLGKGTNNCAEAKALQHGLKWCLSNEMPLEHLSSS
ncbi:hypothetical protein RND71_038424 [Anisodus tanguticus]|uniref:RNase H type-1 domain-containing protein n=1 Tax=Anisodus tanguticus TaxID=243964 RepID=A0AAE1US39_9SOLA|nr:hypothetical protein RND71_038424 [Anisodus tanguticus]